MSRQNCLPGPGVTRRRFVRDGALVGAVTLGFPAIISARSPNSKLNIAIIGAGGRGADNLSRMAAENIVALCDVNRTSLAKAAQKFPQARTYKDFRNLYSKVDDIDAVVVSSTEHTHAVATLPALQMKKRHCLRFSCWKARKANQSQVLSQGWRLLPGFSAP